MHLLWPRPRLVVGLSAVRRVVVAASVAPVEVEPVEAENDGNSSTKSEEYDDGFGENEEHLWEPPPPPVEEPAENTIEDTGGPTAIVDLGPEGHNDDPSSDDDGAGVLPRATRRRVSWGTRATVGTPASELPQRSNARRKSAMTPA